MKKNYGDACYFDDGSQLFAIPTLASSNVVESLPGIQTACEALSWSVEVRR